MSSNVPILFYSNTKTDKNLKYLTKCNVEDDFCLLKIDQHTIALVSALELNRLRKESNIDELYSIEQFRTNHSSTSETIDNFLQKVLKTNSITVPENFPFKIASELIKLGYNLNVYPQSMLSERMIKSNEEVQNIQKVLRIVRECFDHVRGILSESKIIEKNVLSWHNELLTSEFLHAEIENFCYKNNLIAEDTIVSCGEQSADPHCQGYGLVHAHEFIVIDLFPYDRTTGYYADITRTFIKGTPTAEQTKLYNTVKQAQNLAHQTLKPSVSCQQLMSNTLDFFSEQGYKTDRAAKIPYGMFHSLGHGFGLEIHEPPTLSNNTYCLKSGNVVTIEPGLYYPEIGGVRIEDDFLITKDSTIKLSDNISYDWIID